MSERRAFTIKDLAKVAGLSVGGTSYALRGHPCMSAETIARVQKIAAEIGYKPDPRLASLMAHIRRSRPPRNRESLAFVWVSTRDLNEYAPYHQYYLRTIFAGAKKRAEQLGCTLEQFWLDKDNMRPARLEKILRTRAISGIIFSPAMNDLAVTLEWNWSLFACCIIGNTEWNPALHRVGHYHYRSMWLTLQRLRDEGASRPAAILSRSIHERIHGMQLAAFQSNHPNSNLAAELVQFALPEDHSKLRRWPRRLAPDSLIVGWPVNQAILEDLRQAVPTARRVVTLDWQPEGGAPGWDVCNDMIAASAIDVVMAQLHRNERGVPIHPSTLLLDGEWRDPSALSTMQRGLLSSSSAKRSHWEASSSGSAVLI